jgi:hypothetical protein
MLSLENAVPDTLEELELEEILTYDIREVNPDLLYHVTFQEIQNGNNKVVISVEYTTEISDLLDDESWEGEVDVKIVARHGMSETMAEVLMELLAITLDEDYYDSDSSEEEEDSDDETLSLPSQPRTPPPRSSRPLTPPPLPRRRR